VGQKPHLLQTLTAVEKFDGTVTFSALQISDKTTQKGVWKYHKGILSLIKEPNTYTGEKTAF
jgi:hypothetical protein